MSNFFKNLFKKEAKGIEYDFKGNINITIKTNLDKQNIIAGQNKESVLNAFYNNGFNKCICDYYGVSEYFNRLQSHKKSELESIMLSILQICEDNECAIRYDYHYSGLVSRRQHEFSVCVNSKSLKDLIDYLEKL